MENEYGFLGRGWAFPPAFDWNLGENVMLEGEVDIESSLMVLLSTRLGERIMQPTYGCQLDELQFNPLNRTTITYISDLIEKAILYHEPRITVDKILMTNADGQLGLILIELQYTVRATNSRKNLVYPFYKNEATAR
jgi:phage baseplate assembly protein W